MSDQNSKLSREQLYERVWATPLLRMAEEFGISSVALAKRCRKQNIPTPPRGYWAKLEAGKRVAKPPLPPEEQPVPAESKSLSVWPRETSGLCERAQLLLAALQKEKPNYRGLQSVEVPFYPRVAVSKSLVERAVQAYHAILMMVEATGVPFRKARGKYQAAYFEHRLGRLYLEIEELLVMVPGKAAWQPSKETGSGKLNFVLKAESYGHDWKRSWEEGKDGSIREIVTKLASAVSEYYQEQEKKRIEEEERRRVEHERWMKEDEERKKREHAQALVTAQRTREQDLFRAAVWSRLYADALCFLRECEERWAKAGGISADQQSWLDWAKMTAQAWSPWASGYPEPAHDGAFDPTTVPFGGPYPQTRQFPRPPNMPEVPTQEEHNVCTPRREPYPFWLRHPR
jgi:hypothetical protein